MITPNFKKKYTEPKLSQDGNIGFLPSIGGVTLPPLSTPTAMANQPLPLPMSVNGLSTPPVIQPQMPQIAMQTPAMPKQQPAEQVAPTLPDVRSMSNYDLTQNASRDAKTAGASKMMPEQRFNWANENIYAAEKLRRQYEEKQAKKQQMLIHDIGMMVKDGQIDPAAAANLAQTFKIDVPEEYFANSYLPKMRTSSMSEQRTTLPDYYARKQKEAEISRTGILPSLDDAKIMNEIAKYGQTTAKTQQIQSATKTPEQIALESQKIQSEIDRNLGSIKTPEQRQLEIEKVKSEIVKNLRGKELSPTDIKNAKITDVVNEIESKPEGQRTFEDKATLDKYYRGSSGDAEMTQANKLRTEFNALVPFKNYQQSQNIISYMKQAEQLKSGNRIAADQALINGLNKLLDPQSVVRESEYVRTPEGAAVLNKLQGQFERIAKGGVAISDADRTAIVEMANNIMQNIGSQYNESFDRYEKIAKAYGINPDMIFGTLARFDTGMTNPNVGVTKSGLKYTIER